MMFKGERQVTAMYVRGFQVLEAYKGGKLVFSATERHHRHGFSETGDYYTKAEIDAKFEHLINIYGEGGTPQTNIIDINDSGSLIFQTIRNAPPNSIWVGKDGDKKYSLNVSTINSRTYSISYFTGLTTEYIDVTADGEKNRRFVRYQSI